jgi:hypothetical protein
MFRIDDDPGPRVIYRLTIILPNFYDSKKYYPPYLTFDRGLFIFGSPFTKEE